MTADRKRTRRATAAFLAVAFAVGVMSRPARAEDNGFAIKDGDRVVIYGDSITAGAQFPNSARYLETYLRTRFPDRQIEFWNRARSGDRAANLERFKRDCLSLKPDVITINMGMNDAGYTPEIATRLRQFIQNLTRMVEAARETNPNVRIFLLSPILYEFKVQGARAFYPYVLWAYSEEEKKLARRLEVGFVNLTRRYGETIGLAHGMFPDRAVFSGDGIHPVPAGGHLFMATHILRALGAEPVLASLQIAADTGKVASVKGQEVSSVTSSTKELVFDRKLEALPFPVVSEYDSVVFRDRSVSFLVAVADELNRDVLKVTGLEAKSYLLKIDDREIGQFSTDELADGINLSLFFNTPDQEQALTVCDAVGAKQIHQSRLWYHSQKAPEGDSVTAELDAKTREAIAKVNELNKPARHRFVLTARDEEVDRYRRHEQCLQLTGTRLLRVGEGQPEEQELKVQVKNLSLATRRVEMLWAEGEIEPPAGTFTLKPDEERQLAYRARLTADDSAPVLEVKHLPTDLSFPSIVQRLSPALVPHLAVPRASGLAKLDGRLSEWEGAARLDLDRKLTQAGRRRRSGVHDFSATCHLMWDDDHLYAGVGVRDQDHTNHFTDGRINWDDSVILTLGPKTYSLALAESGPTAWPESAAKEGVLFDVRHAEGQTTYEVAIPWTALPTDTPKLGTTYSFGLHVSDRDRDQSYKSLNLSGTGRAQGPAQIRLVEILAREGPGGARK